MGIFQIIDGRHTISGDVVRIERIETGHGRREGHTLRTSLLSNGKVVGLVYRGDNTLGILTGKGARFERITGDTILKFYVDGELVATVGAEDVDKFTVTA